MGVERAARSLTCIILLGHDTASALGGIKGPVSDAAQLGCVLALHTIVRLICP
jgi:hypothetical protein